MDNIFEPKNRDNRFENAMNYLLSFYCNFCNNTKWNIKFNHTGKKYYITCKMCGHIETFDQGCFNIAALKNFKLF